MYDIIIVGGGPAGLTAAVYGLRAGKSVVVIEKNGFGGQIAYSPKVENIPGTAQISGAEFADKLTEQAMLLGADMELETVTGLQKTEKGFLVSTEDGAEFEGRTVILALGVKHRMLGLPGEEALIGGGISFCAVCDGAFYAGQDVAMVGGGNSAAADALVLSRIAKKVYLIHRRDQLRATKIYHEPLEKAENVEFSWNSTVVQLLGEKKLSGVVLKNVQTGEESELSCDGLFVSVGRKPVTELVEGQLELDRSGYVVAGESTVTNIPGVYAVGDMRTKKLRQVVTAVADGAVAVHMAEEYLM